MIISASRRTDIPANHMDWFLEQFTQGYVITQNPMNANQTKVVSLKPEDVTALVFWTKDPRGILENLETLKPYKYYVQVSINPYGTDIEPRVPSKGKVVIPTFQELSKHIGAGRMVWRYDPILFNKTYTVEHHSHYFEKLAKALSGYTDRCVISFLDDYRHIRKKLASQGILPLDLNDDAHQATVRSLARTFAQIGKQYGIGLQTCCEAIDLTAEGVPAGACIDVKLIEQMGVDVHRIRTDAHQRGGCLCAKAVDIGTYNTCRQGCLYCYANRWGVL